MSIDPINPGYLDHLFDGGISQPHRVERVPARSERERSEQESEDRRRREGNESSAPDRMADRRSYDEDDSEYDDERNAGAEHFESSDDDDDRRKASEPDFEQENFEEILVDAVLVDHAQPSIDRTADDDQAEQEDEDLGLDAVVVEIDDEEPPRESRIERRRRPEGDGHIDFEA